MSITKKDRMSEKDRKKFRNSAKWKKFRNDIIEKFDHVDPITNKPLRKGCNIHHLDMDKDNYEVLIEEHFLPLNKNTHEMIHWCYRYASTDDDFMNRLTYFVQKMLEINKDL